MTNTWRILRKEYSRMTLIIQEMRTLQMFVHIFLDLIFLLSVLFANTPSISDWTEVINAILTNKFRERWLRTTPKIYAKYVTFLRLKQKILVIHDMKSAKEIGHRKQIGLFKFSETTQLSTEQKRIGMPHDSGLVRSKDCGEGMAVLCCAR